MKKQKRQAKIAFDSLDIKLGNIQIISKNGLALDTEILIDGKPPEFVITGLTLRLDTGKNMQTKLYMDILPKEER